MYQHGIMQSDIFWYKLSLMVIKNYLLVIWKIPNAAISYFPYQDWHYMNSKVIVSYILIHLEVKDFHIDSHKGVNVLKIRVNGMCKRIRQIGLTKAILRRVERASFYKIQTCIITHILLITFQIGVNFIIDFWGATSFI